jgi:glycosyltransferase involved in cell wall biosynthesis
MAVDSLRICLLTYRGNPRSGGQGVYTRLLSSALTELGHQVDVWSGPPYPEVPSGVGLVKVPSLDLWNEDGFHRLPSWDELRDPINFSEWAQTKTGNFPEPLTFSRRVERSFRNGVPRYDLVHDNQCLGPGLLQLRQRLPVVATIHHPVTVDRRIALKQTQGWLQRYGLRRWYSFLSTQLKVSRQLDRILTVSEASRQDLHREYGISVERMRVVGNGIDVDRFRPLPGIRRKPNQIITTLSSDSPLKGFRYLLDAIFDLRSHRPDLKLTVIGSAGQTDTQERVERLGLQDTVHFTGYVAADDIVRAYAESSVAVVPSLYEGFGFPAGEAMACEVPIVSTAAGALPEVVGTDGRAGVLVEPRNPTALARAIDELLSDPQRRSALGHAGRTRVLQHFTWRRAAERTAAVYREAITEHAARTPALANAHPTTNVAAATPGAPC